MDARGATDRAAVLRQAAADATGAQWGFEPGEIQGDAPAVVLHQTTLLDLLGIVDAARALLRGELPPLDHANLRAALHRFDRR